MGEGWYGGGSGEARLKPISRTESIFSRGHATLHLVVSVGPSIGPSVRPAIDFSAFASGFRITAPAQSHETDVVVYTGPPAAPAPHITAPAQPHATMPVRVSGLVCKVTAKVS